MSHLSNLVSQVTKLEGQAPQKVAALVGAVTGDAAALHLEWVYDQDKLAKIIGSNEPEFWQESQCSFFTLPNGKMSCYGNETVESLSVMAGNEGAFDADKTCQHFLKHFGDPTSTYQVALAKRKDKQFPIEGPWINSGVNNMMEMYRGDIRPPGSVDSKDHDGLAVALPLIIQQASHHDGSALAPAINIMTQKRKPL
jgi:hypothetical protein